MNGALVNRTNVLTGGRTDNRGYTFHVLRIYKRMTTHSQEGCPHMKTSSVVTLNLSSSNPIEWWEGKCWFLVSERLFKKINIKMDLHQYWQCWLKGNKGLTLKLQGYSFTTHRNHSWVESVVVQQYRKQNFLQTMALAHFSNSELAVWRVLYVISWQNIVKHNIAMSQSYFQRLKLRIKDTI